MGFLHYIYEKLNLKIIVLADSSKLEDEIDSKDYLKKFFIDIINLNSVDYREIIKDLSSNEIFVENQGIQEEIIDEFRSEIEDDKKTKIELLLLKADYYKIMNKLENPRSYQSVKNIYIEIKNQIKEFYNFSEQDLEKYENLILRMAFYKEIYKDTQFSRGNLYKNNYLIYILLCSNKEKDEIEKSLIELLNNSKDDVLKAKEIIEGKIINKNIEDILKNFKIYFDTFYSVNKKYKENLIEYYRSYYDISKEKLSEKTSNLYNLDFNALVYIDRMYYVENGNSLIYDLFKDSNEIRYRNNSDNNISKAVKLISEDLIKKVKEFRVDEAERHYNKFNDFYMCYVGYEQEDEKVIEISLEIIEEIKDKTDKNSELNNLEKKYLEYFIELFKLYFSGEKYNLKNMNKDFEDLKSLLEELKNIKENMKTLSNSFKIDDQMSFEEEEKTYKEIYKEFEDKRNILMSSFYYSLEIDEYFKKKIEVCLEIDKYGIRYDDYSYGKSKESEEKFSDYYKKIIMEKEYLRNLKFEEIIDYRDID